MAWNNPVINGANSVSSNKTPLNENSAYIETTLQQDHYWDENANLDGRHKQVNMADSSPDPSIGTDCDGVIFHKEITKNAGGTTESVAVHKNSGYVGYLGIRAWVNFSVSGGVATIESQYGVTSVTRNATGQYTIVFSQTMPTNNYCVQGTAFAENVRNPFVVAGNLATTSWNTDMTTSQAKISVVRPNGSTGTGFDASRVTVMFVGG